MKTAAPRKRHRQQSFRCQRQQQQRQHQRPQRQPPDRQRNDRHVEIVSVPRINIPLINCCTTVSMTHRKNCTCKSQNRWRHRSHEILFIGPPTIVKRIARPATMMLAISQNVTRVFCSDSVVDKTAALLHSHPRPHSHPHSHARVPKTHLVSCTDTCVVDSTTTASNSSICP